MSNQLPYITLALFFAAAIRVSIPLMLGAMGESLSERAGNLNLGVEGMMLMGGAAGFVVAVRTDNLLLAILAAMLSSGMGAAIYAFLTVTLRTNQVVTGLALTIFGAGFANTFGKSVSGIRTPERIAAVFSRRPLNIDISALEEIPLIGPVSKFISLSLLQHNLYIYFTVVLASLLTIYLYKTQQGLHLRAVGENPYAADAAGIRVGLIKYIYVILGGSLCGLAGLYMPMVHVGSWIDNITAGRGWIVVALVIFVRWDPLKAIAGSVFFGALEVFKFYLDIIPGLRRSILFNPYFLEMYPYLITIVVLVLTYASKKGRWLGPSSLGLAYYREDR